ncbi:MAG: hypothetical protein HY617_01640 [Candidatus Sungbacteria bacterium]|nr:hypothetical protein [Candidatus Sungbacteria bacterium]
MDIIERERPDIAAYIDLQHDVNICGIVCDRTPYVVMVWTTGIAEEPLELVRDIITTNDPEAKPCADADLETFLTSTALQEWVDKFVAAEQISRN